MQKELSANIQDYLKHIYEVTSSGGKATTSQLAENLGISPASVTNMLQKLSKTQPAYLTYQKHQGVRLTKEGRQAALKIIRRHRLIEHYLVEKLGYTWDEVHQEAEVLEHAMSPLLERRIDAALGYPDFDPHGDPIPNADLEMPEIKQITLNNLENGGAGQITRVPHQDSDVLRDLGTSGLRPGTHIRLLTRTPYDQTMRVLIEETGEKIIIGPNLGSEIYLSPEQ